MAFSLAELLGMTEAYRILMPRCRDAKCSPSTGMMEAQSLVKLATVGTGAKAKHAAEVHWVSRMMHWGAAHNELGIDPNVQSSS